MQTLAGPKLLDLVISQEAAAYIHQRCGVTDCNTGKLYDYPSVYETLLKQLGVDSFRCNRVARMLEDEVYQISIGNKEKLTLTLFGAADLPFVTRCVDLVMKEREFLKTTEHGEEAIQMLHQTIVPSSLRELIRSFWIGQGVYYAPGLGPLKP